MVYKASPTGAALHSTPSFFRGIKGPFGSGKSSICVMEINRVAHTIDPCRDGVRRSRWVAVRATYPELKSTTIKTWLEWLGPKHGYPNVVYDVPIRWRYRWQYSGTQPDVELEVLFLAAETADDIDKLKSLDVTGIWLNEVSELSKAILDMATSRAGRYPPKMDMPADYHSPNKWPSWHGIIVDTNPPDDDHWYYKLAEVQRPKGYTFFNQPGGFDPGAENIDYLPGGRNYYTQLAAGKRDSWVKVYVHGQYGSTQDGRPVYPEFNRDVHVALRPLEILRGMPLELGHDYGITPACVAVQTSPTGQVRVLREWVIGVEDELGYTGTMGTREFTRDVVIPALNREFDEMEVRSYGDPGAVASSQNDNKTALLIQSEEGLHTTAARSNLHADRKDAVITHLQRWSSNGPGLIIDPSCKYLIKALNGGYRYKRTAVAGKEMYKDVPEKNEFSHVAEALEYVLLEIKGGRYKMARANSSVLRNRQRARRPVDRAYGY
jgi:hypothetical protein